MLRKTTFILISLLVITAGVYGQGGQQDPEPTGFEKIYEIGKPEEKVLIDFAALPEDLTLDRWEIKLSGYSDNPLSRRNSSVKIVDVAFDKIEKEWQDKYNEQLNKSDFNKALGIRVYYEYSHGNDWAQIKTKLPIDPYYAKESQGILKNIGPIKSISMWVSGRNYKNSIEVRLLDQRGQYKSINFGNLYVGGLYFRGWRKLTWYNPNYIKELQKRDIVKEHLYPQYLPYLKFDSIVIYKSPQEPGGDFVTYVKDVRIEYEPAIKDYDKALEAYDIKDEVEWGIQGAKAKEIKERQDRFYDIYFSGSSQEDQYLKDKAKREETSGEKTK